MNRPTLYCYDDLTSPWAKFFAPKTKETILQFLVPKDWQFFSTLLMSPKHFSHAKEFIQSKALLSCISDGQFVGFSLPNKCPIKALPACTLWNGSETLAEDTDVDPLEAPP